MQSEKLPKIRRTTCCGKSVNEPRFRTSVPKQQQNSKYFIMRHEILGIFITMFIDKLQDLLNERFCAFVLNVTLGTTQKSTNCVDCDASLLNKATACSLQLLETVIICGIHDAKQRSWLQCDIPCVNILDHLTKDICNVGEGIY